MTKELIVTKQTVISNSENVNKITLEKNSFLNLNEIKHIDNLTVDMMDNSELNLFNLDITDKENTNITVNLIGRNSKVFINTRTYTDETIKKTFNINIHHLNEETESHIVNYGVANDQSNITMNVTSRIEKGNKKSSAHQNTKVISLSEHATAKLTPILEIKEFDVEGSHSATFSKITESEIYYLQSRGFTKKQATFLITVSTLSAGTKEDLEAIIEERVSHE